MSPQSINIVLGMSRIFLLLMLISCNKEKLPAEPLKKITDYRVKYIDWREHIHNSVDTIYYHTVGVSMVKIANSTFGSVTSNQRLAFFYENPLSYKYYYLPASGDTARAPHSYVWRRSDGRLLQTIHPHGIYHHADKGGVYFQGDPYYFAQYDERGNEIYKQRTGYYNGYPQLFQEYKSYDTSPNVFENLCYGKWIFYAPNKNNLKQITVKVSGQIIKETTYALKYDPEGRLISMEDTIHHDFAVHFKYDY